MFESIRTHKKYLMAFLMILIVPSFVLWGVDGYTRLSQRSEAVAMIGDQEITREEWDRAHQQQVQRMQQQMPGIDVKVLDSDGARYGTLENLVRDRVLTAAAQQFHLFASDQRLVDALNRDTTIASLRKADGTLDTEAYRQLLSAQGMTPESFEAGIRSDLSRQQVVAGIQSTAIMPASVANMALEAFYQRRELSFKPFLAKDFASQVSPSDADIEAFYKDNANLFQAPEQVNIEYVVLDGAKLADTVKLDENEVKAYFQQNMDRMAKRRASHILLTVPAGASESDKAAVREKAQKLLEEVRKNPESFADVAKANSQDPGSAAQGGDLGFFQRNAMVKPFEDAAFALKKGEISDVVETEFGFHIIRLTDLQEPDFATVKADLEKDLRKQQAQKLFGESAETFSNLVYEQSDSLQPAADKFGLTVQSAKGVTRNGVGEQGPKILNTPKLLEALFAADSLEKKDNTPAIEAGNSQLVAARVKEHIPQHTRELAEVKDAVRTQLVARRSAELAREAGEKALAQAKEGKAEVTMPAAVVIARDDAQGIPPTVVDAVMSADPKAFPEWKGVSMGDAGYALVKVLAVKPRAEAPAAKQTQEIGQVRQWWAAAVANAYYDELKKQLKVKILVPEPAPAKAP